MNIKSQSLKLLADLMTPVGVFMKIREYFSEVLLLESSEYASKEDSHSFICFDPIFTIQLDYGKLQLGPNVTNDHNVIQNIQDTIQSIKIEGDDDAIRYNGFFGFSTYDAVQYFENIQLDRSKSENHTPILRYDMYRYIIVMDNFKNEMYLIENRQENEPSKLSSIRALLYRQDHLTFDFNLVGEECSTTSEDDYLNMVTKAKKHCQRGDVFQMVLARRFKQNFKGDEFNVYRALRSINPSPYLYYFDYGSFKIFGSSPEAQIKVQNGEAEIHPIAGTFRRTGAPIQDQALAIQLGKDPKESSEHVMLVDLARNDLSKNTQNVKVTSFKEVQFFSHVIHLVSKVTGKLAYGKSGFQIFGDTFPAGTLSGAPKHKAMTLIDQYEPHGRSFFGGAIGMLKLNGDVNQAIIIRSFLSTNGELHYQAGAGLVIDSDEQKELQEVNNKLAALKKALVQAEEI